MSSIVKYTCEELDNAEISCLTVNGEPWFKGIEVAILLGYKCPKKALFDHIPLKFKNKLTYLVRSSKVTKTVTLDVDELNAPWICEAGLYKLILKSKAKNAEVFQDWVCEEVLPQIRKTGSYMSHDEAVNKIRNPTGETKLHYKVKAYIARKYPNVIISAGQGENQTTEFQRMDAKAKGYTKGEPDMELKCKLGNGYTDVVAIELKNPNGSNWTTPEQDAYLERLRLCNVTTLVTNDYDDVVIFLHEHYQKIKQEDARLLAIKDEPKQTFNFATNDNPNYWCNKLKNHTGLAEECEKRGISKDEFYIKTKRDIASILITFDKNN